MLFVACQNRDETTQLDLNETKQTGTIMDSSTGRKIIIVGSKVVLDEASGFPILVLNDFSQQVVRIKYLDLMMKVRREIERLQSQGDEGSDRLKAYEKAQQILSEHSPT